MLPLLFMMNGISMKRRLCKNSKIVRNNLHEENRKLDRTDQRCRTCLGTKNLQNIFSGKELELKRSNEFYTICGLDVKPDDGLPQKICYQCSKALAQAIKFRKISRKSERSLIDYEYRKKEIKVVKKEKKPKTEKVEIDLEPLYNYNNILGDDFYDGRDEEEMQQKKPKVKKKPKKGNETQYRCNTCNKEFKMKATYKAHMRFHTNYCVCEVCGKRCRNHYQLQEHKRAKHDLSRIHKCTFCEYSSATKEALTIHERRHTGERPYVCDHCGATFHRRSNLVQHIAIHNPDNNFQCDMCPKRLKSRKFLQIHKHNAHTGRRYGYLCGACGHRFDKPNKVRAHARRVHALPDENQPPVVRVQL